MKLKKWIAVCCLGLVFLSLLSGCGTSTKPLPEGMDEQTLIAAGQEIMDMMNAGNYEEVATRFREDIRTDNNITADTIREMMKTYADPEVVGEFKKVADTVTSGETEGETHGFVVFECDYTEKVVAFAVAFDPNMQLIGLSMARD